MSEHEHTFTEWEVRPIRWSHATPPNKDYKGMSGDRAFLVQQCANCPKVEARDYGKTEDMQDKLERILSNAK